MDETRARVSWSGRALFIGSVGETATQSATGVSIGSNSGATAFGGRRFLVRLTNFDDGYHYIGHKLTDTTLSHSRSYPKKDRRPLFFSFKSRLVASSSTPVYGPCDILVFDEKHVRLGQVARKADGSISILSCHEESGPDQTGFYIMPAKGTREGHEDGVLEGRKVNTKEPINLLYMHKEEGGGVAFFPLKRVKYSHFDNHFNVMAGMSSKV